MLLSLTILLGLPVFASAAQTSVQNNSHISAYMELYGYKLSQDVIKRYKVEYEPQAIDCGDILVNFREILYDGQWAYVAASVSPKDPTATLVLPGDAQAGDPVAGFYGETTRQDERTFQMAAKEDGKQLLSVYAYIKEFDEIGAYFLDHLQEGKDESILFSGAQLAGGKDEMTITLSVQIYNVDLANNEYTLHKEQLVPMTVRPLQPYTERLYKVVDGEDAPFTHVMLVHTPLSTYVKPQWNSEEVQNYIVTLVDADGLMISQGAPPAMNGYGLERLPEQITLSLVNREAEESKMLVTLVADDMVNVVP